MDENTEANAPARQADSSVPSQAAAVDLAEPLFMDGQKGPGQPSGQPAEPEIPAEPKAVADKGDAPDKDSGAKGKPDAKDDPAAKPGFDAKAWDEYVSGLADFPDLDKDALRDFGKMAGGLGLNAQGVEKIFTWGLKNAQKVQEAQTSANREALQEEWGADYERNIEKATSVVAMLDRQLGDNRFKKAIEKSGACRDADFARGLCHIAELLSEDSLGIPAQGSQSMKEESALEGLKTFFK